MGTPISMLNKEYALAACALLLAFASHRAYAGMTEDCDGAPNTTDYDMAALNHNSSTCTAMGTKFIKASGAVQAGSGHGHSRRHAASDFTITFYNDAACTQNATTFVPNPSITHEYHCGTIVDGANTYYATTYLNHLRD